MKYALREFSKEAGTNVFVLDADRKNEIKYTDGNAVENKIFNIINDAKDRSLWSKELIKKITDWPTEYHLSPVRHNLLRHVSFNSNDRILELGCGCGAITRQLGESGAHVTAVEGTMNRAKCAAARCGDLPNVEIYCSNFQNVEFQRKYDYVTLIGVLEYAPLFFSGEDPFEDCLKIVKSALRPGGKLLIAIENRMGLKYFNGFGEDHVDRPYFGIEDRYNSKTAKTFGKRELASALKNSGFSSLEFLYPFPDYKLPEVIIHEAAFDQPEFNSLELIRYLQTRDYAQNRKPNFSEFMAWKSVAENGLLGDLSNSFLVEASLEPVVSSRKFLAIKYTDKRRLPYNTSTEFILRDNQLKVLKSPLCKEEISDSHVLKQNLDDDIYYPGVTLASLLREKIVRDDFDGYVSLVRIWLDYLVSHGATMQKEVSQYDTPLQSRFIDCLPGNLIANGKSMNFIDREWDYQRPFSAKTLFIRYWLNEKHFSSDLFLKFMTKHVPHDGAAPLSLLINFAKVFQMNFDEGSVKEHFQKFAEVGEIVYGAKFAFSAFFENPKTSDKMTLRKFVKALTPRKIRSLMKKKRK